MGHHPDHHAHLHSHSPRRTWISAAIALLVTLAFVASTAAMTSHAGWPADQHLVMDKGPAGQANVLTGEDGVHNYLLGGYGNDTIYGGNAGDVIWGDYHESGWPSFQTTMIHAGDGPRPQAGQGTQPELGRLFGVGDEADRCAVVLAARIAGRDG